MNKENYILKTENLVAGYGEHIVLNEVSFVLEKGEILVIIGQNGSGKSTLLKTLSGLIRKKSGNTWLKKQSGNNILPHQFVRNGISYFTQGGLIMPALSVLEHLELAALQSGFKPEKTSFNNTFAEFPKLKELLKQKAGNLSGGERQLLSFGILLMQRTDIWLLDEPTAGLSPDMVQFSADFLRRKNYEGITMLIVEHNMDVAFGLATHIVVAKAGKLTKKFNHSEFSDKNFLNKIVYN